ncbi:MAG: IclR family transcriptional regulator [Alphaproteobacteria bacterium]|nr:IclR family transcriptional regulator [Alphaproteobacteria bacterium]
MKSDSLLNSPTSKIMAILREVAQASGATLATLAGNLNLPPPTVYRIATELERLGYLQRYPGDRKWHVGVGLVELSRAAMTSGIALSRIKEILQDLASDIGETVTFGTLSGNTVSYVLSIELDQPLTLSFRAGRSGPLYCTSSGRVFLAAMNAKDLAAYFRQARLVAYTPQTETDPEKIERIVRKVRDRGFAITLQEYVSHVSGVAVPIKDETGTMFGTLGISVPHARGRSARLRSLVPRIQESARLIADCLSGKEGDAAG